MKLPADTARCDGLLVSRKPPQLFSLCTDCLRRTATPDALTLVEPRVRMGMGRTGIVVECPNRIAPVLVDA
jgi:hypothetical protein